MGAIPTAGVAFVAIPAGAGIVGGLAVVAAPLPRPETGTFTWVALNVTEAVALLVTIHVV